MTYSKKNSSSLRLVTCQKISGEISMSFNSFIRNRMDQLLRAEDAEPLLLRRYSDIEITEYHSQVRLRQLSQRVVEKIAVATNAYMESTPSVFKKELRQIYPALIDVILTVDMPLDTLFPNTRFDLDDLRMEEEEVDTEAYAWSVVETLCLAMNELKEAVDEVRLYYFLEMAHYNFIKWVFNENITQKELLA